MAEATIGCRDRPRRSVRLFLSFSLACRGSGLVSKNRAAAGGRPSPARHSIIFGAAICTSRQKARADSLIVSSSMCALAAQACRKKIVAHGTPQHAVACGGDEASSLRRRAGGTAAAMLANQ
jgi:hypothetical protein